MSAEKYKILRSLNMSGTVTLAKDTESGRKYVLRTLTDDSIAIYRRITALPPNDCLAAVYDIDGNTAVCGYAEGESLDELLENGREFPAAQIRRIIYQLCTAASLLHSCGLIHRDITPKNIILDSKLHLTLIDYGIARVFRGTKGQDTTVCGTAGFAAPEQYSFRETDAAADIYSIGGILRLLLGHCPDCPAAQEVLLRRTAAKCMRFDPGIRYKSADRVKRAVRRSAWIIPAAASAVTLAASAAVFAAVTYFAASSSLPADASHEETDEAAFSAPSEAADTGGVFSVETVQTPRGFYSDVFEYSFTDDPSLHGTWNYLNTIPLKKASRDISRVYIENYRYVGMHDFYGTTAQLAANAFAARLLASFPSYSTIRPSKASALRRPHCTI